MNWDVMSFFRSPKIKKSMRTTPEDQIQKIDEEVQEIHDALFSKSSYYDPILEAMDAIVALESFIQDFDLDPATVDMLWELTIRKNYRRGYYEDDLEKHPPEFLEEWTKPGFFDYLKETDLELSPEAQKVYNQMLDELSTGNFQ